MKFVRTCHRVKSQFAQNLIYHGKWDPVIILHQRMFYSRMSPRWTGAIGKTNTQTSINTYIVTTWYCFYYFTNLYDFSDEWHFEVLIQFYVIIQQHILNKSVTVTTDRIHSTDSVRKRLWSFGNILTDKNQQNVNKMPRNQNVHYLYMMCIKLFQIKCRAWYC